MSDGATIGETVFTNFYKRNIFKNLPLNYHRTRKVVIRAPSYGGCPIVISLSLRACVCERLSQMKFSWVFFYNISYMNLKLSMKFF
jgi:hypothetical protein